MGIDAFNHHKIKKIGSVFFCFDNIYTLILAADIAIYLSFIIIWRSFEIDSSFGQSFAMKTVHYTTFKNYQSCAISFNGKRNFSTNLYFQNLKHFWLSQHFLKQKYIKWFSYANIYIRYYYSTESDAKSL